MIHNAVSFQLPHQNWYALSWCPRMFFQNFFTGLRHNWEVTKACFHLYAIDYYMCKLPAFNNLWWHFVENQNGNKITPPSKIAMVIPFFHYVYNVCAVLSPPSIARFLWLIFVNFYVACRCICFCSWWKEERGIVKYFVAGDQFYEVQCLWA